MSDSIDVCALEELRVGVEMDAAYDPSGDAKLAALDRAIAMLRQSGEADRRDAERYRLLRDGGFTVLDDSSVYAECCGTLEGVGLDAAIDAALAAHDASIGK